MDKRDRKKKIAFLGGGAHTIPSYRALLMQLTLYYDVVVYSEFHLSSSRHLPYGFKSVPPGKMPRRIREFLFAWLIFKDIVLKKVDLLHSHSTFPAGFWGIVLGKLSGLPVIVSLDAAEASALPGIGFGDLLNPKRKAVNSWVIRNANEVIVLTHFLLREVRQNLGIKRTMHVIPRGVNTDLFKFKERKISKPVRFINVAYLSPVKDQETLLRCFSIINTKIECEMIHIGEDFNDGQTQRLAIALGLADKIQFKGLIANDKLPEYYAHSDILLHTSLYESQAVVVCEAMASGVLVCGTHVGLLADLSGKCCLTVKPGDAEQLAEIILRLIADPGQMTLLRNTAHEWAIAHNLQWTANRHREIYDTVTK